MKLFHNFPEKILFAANTFLSSVLNVFGKKNLQPKEILVVKIDEIGDMVVATPVFRLLKQKYPDAKLSLLCKPMCKPLMEHNPFVDIVFTSQNEWKKRYDVVIELRGTWKTWLKSIIYTPKYRLDRGSVRFRNKLIQGNLSDHQTNFLIVKPLVGEIPIPQPELYSAPSDKEFVEQIIQQHGLKSFGVFHATANKRLKEWSQDRFAQLADNLVKDFGLQIVFIGAPNESERIELVIKKMQHPAFNLAGKFTLTQLLEFFKQAALYLGNDSGPMHIANVADIPLVGLFGPGPAHVFYPIGVKARVLHHVLPCNPCNQIDCIQPNDFCMDRIKVEDVMGELRELKFKNA